VASTKSANCRQPSGLEDRCVLVRDLSSQSARRPTGGEQATDRDPGGRHDHLGGVRLHGPSVNLTIGMGAPRASCSSSLITPASAGSSLPAGDGGTGGSSRRTRMLTEPGSGRTSRAPGAAPLRAHRVLCNYYAWQPPAVVIGRASRQDATVGRPAHGIAGRCRSQPRANTEVPLSSGGPHQPPMRSRRRPIAVSGRSRRSWSALPVSTRPRRGSVHGLLLPGWATVAARSMATTKAPRTPASDRPD
jgi:hypothetical protein